MNTDLTSLLVGIVAVLAFFGNVLITIVGLKLPTHPKNLTQVQIRIRLFNCLMFNTSIIYGNFLILEIFVFEGRILTS